VTPYLMTKLRHFRNRSFYWLTNYLADKDTAENAWFSVLDGMLYTIMVGLTQPFMTLYAMSLGASDTMIGFFTSWPSLVSLLAQVPSALITERLQEIKTSLLRWAFVHRLNYLIYALIPYLPISGVNKAWVFILLVTLNNFPGVVVNAMWTQLMGRLFLSRERAKVFADRNFLTSVVTLCFLLVSGSILDLIPYPYNYTLSFSVGFVALMISLFFLSRLKEKPVEPPVASLEEVTTAPAKTSPWAGMKTVIRDKGFVALTLSLVIMHIGFGFSSALWTIFYRRQLLLSSTQIARISIISTCSSMLYYRLVPKVITKLGNQGTFLLGVLGYAPLPFLYAQVSADNLWFLWAIAVFDGLVGPTYSLSFFNIILDSAQNETYRPSYLAFYNTCISIPGVIFPMIGMQLYLYWGGLSVAPVFYIASGIRFVAVVMLALVFYTGRRRRLAGRS